MFLRFFLNGFWENSDIAGENVTGDVVSDGTARITGGAISGVTSAALGAISGSTAALTGAVSIGNTTASATISSTASFNATIAVTVNGTLYQIPIYE